MNEKFDRNKQLFAKHLKGVTIEKLALEYGISYSAVSKICQRYKKLNSAEQAGQ